MRIHVSKLKGPVFADYELLFDVPNGSILVAWDEEDAARLRMLVKPGVMVVTRSQEQAGVAYVDPRASRADAAPEVEEAEAAEHDIYEVEAVIDARKKGKGMEYLIKWKGYDEGKNTWEPEVNVSEPLIAQYHGRPIAAADEGAAAGDDATTAATESTDAVASDAAVSDDAVPERSGAPRGTWFHVDGYAVRAWGEASKVTQRMRSLLIKTKKRARDVGVCDECIGDPKRYSSKSCRMGMATEHRGKVPFDYTMDEGGWSTRAVAKGYQEEEAAFAENQIIGTDVVLGGATADDALVTRIVERSNAAEVAELRERAATAEAEAAKLRAILGISNAGNELSMEARVTSVLSTLQSGALRPTAPAPQAVATTDMSEVLQVTAAPTEPPSAALTTAMAPAAAAAEAARAVEAQIAPEQVMAVTMVEPMAAAIASALAGELALTGEPTLTAAALTAAAGQMNGASPPVAASGGATTAAPAEATDDLRRCCKEAPQKGEATRWSQHRATIVQCCSTGWATTDALQKLLCAANVHTQHKALKSYIGRNPQLRANARSV